MKSNDDLLALISTRQVLMCSRLQCALPTCSHATRWHERKNPRIRAHARRTGQRANVPTCQRAKIPYFCGLLTSDDVS